MTSVTTADGASASNNQITKQMICEGLWKGIVKIEVNDSNELICKIGGYWFIFDTFWNDHYTNLTIYLVHTDIIELVVNIFSAIEDMKNTNEYKYYYWYLKENLKG